MGGDATLAYTIHHKGQAYRAGTTAEEIGPAAAEFGDHVWAGGKPPAKQATVTAQVPGAAPEPPAPPAGSDDPVAPPGPAPEPAPKTTGSSRRTGS